jgi:putative FmdB family regulatory protein
LPTYEYRCLSCNHQFERFQRMSDEPVRECEECGCEVQRVLFPVAVHFKGSGFYTTDYGKKKTLRAGGGSSGADSEGAKSESGGRSETPAKADKAEKTEKASAAVSSDS